MALRFVPAKGISLPSGARTEFGPTISQWPGAPAVKNPFYISDISIAVESVIDGAIGPHGRTRGMDQALVTQFGPTIRRGRQEIAPTLIVNDRDVIFRGRRGNNPPTWTMPNYLIGLRGGLKATYTISGADYPGTLEAVDSKP